MRAKTVRFIVQGLLFVASAVALAPQAGMALGDRVGEFTLPVEVHWGEVVLPPGAYSISAGPLHSTTMLCVHKRGTSGANYFIPAVEQEPIPVTFQKTQLVMGEKDGRVYVKELQLGGEGLQLHYAPPKSKK